MDLSREQNRVAIERDKGIFCTDKGFEILCFGYTYRGTVKILAPDYIVGVLHLNQTRIVGIFGHTWIPILIYECDPLLVKIPVYAILASAQVYERDAIRLLSSKNPNKIALIGYYCAVKNPRDTRDRIAANDRIFIVPPDRNG